MQTYAYDAYSNILTTSGSITNPYRFSTKEYSSNAKLLYFGARYYSPKIGRWLKPDPSGMVDGPNVYLYVANNPVNWVDPEGMCIEAMGGQEFLSNLSDLSYLAATGCFLSGLGTPGTIVFGGIGAGAKALEISLYSEDPVKDTTKETIKMGVGSKVGDPASMFTDEIIDQADKYLTPE